MDSQTTGQDSRGKYVIFEGPDGCGKTTIATLVAKELDAVFVRNPGATELGKRLRQILKHELSVQIDGESEQLLFLADHVAFCNQILKPNLEAGRIVLADRHNGISGLMYSSNWIQKFYDALPEYRADLLLVFSCPFEVCKKRATIRGEKCRFESRGDEFLMQVHANYRNFDKYGNYARNVVVINAEKSIGNIVDDVLDAVSMIQL